MLATLVAIWGCVTSGKGGIVVFDREVYVNYLCQIVNFTGYYRFFRDLFFTSSFMIFLSRGSASRGFPGGFPGGSRGRVFKTMFPRGFPGAFVFKKFFVPGGSFKGVLCVFNRPS